MYPQQLLLHQGPRVGGRQGRHGHGRHHRLRPEAPRRRRLRRAARRSASTSTSIRRSARSNRSRPSPRSFRPCRAKSSRPTGDLNGSPESVNQDPHGKGWIIKLKMDDPGRPQRPHEGRRLREIPRRPRRTDMSYIALSDNDKKEMLARIGISSAEELYGCLPDEVKLRRRLDLPAAMSEAGAPAGSRRWPRRNTYAEFLSFLGAGVYRHFIPSVVDYLSARGGVRHPLHALSARGQPRGRSRSSSNTRPSSASSRAWTSPTPRSTTGRWPRPRPS